MAGLSLGLGLGLGSRNGISQEAIVRALLFSAGEPGFLYDFSDFSSLRQDSIGTTPVTAVGQPLGLVLDKSKGMALGPELRGGGYLVTSGTGSTGTYDTVTGEATLSRINVSNRTDIRVPVPIGGFFALDIEVTSGALGVRDGGATAVLLIGAGTRQQFIVPNTANNFLAFVVTGDGTTASFIVHSVRSIAGNHAYQPTAASRPILGRHPITGLRNLATGSANVGPATNWRDTSTQNGITATKVASGIDTDGLPYVDIRYQGTTTGLSHNAAYDTVSSRAPASVGQTYTSTAYAQLIAGSLANHILRVQQVEETAPVTYVAEAQSASATATETLLSVTRTVATGNQVRTAIFLGFVSGVVIDATYRIKGLQFELGSTRTAYQFNYNSFDTTEPGVASAYYASFDGVDDFLVTNTITPGTDKVQTFTGVRKLSDAATTCLHELSPDAGSNNGGFAVFAPIGAGSASYSFRSRGTTTATATTPISYPAPITNVVVGLGDISGDIATIQVNNDAPVTVSTDQGSGNYLAYQVFIGRRAGTSFPLNGRVYMDIIRFGPNLTPEAIAQTKAFVAQHTGVTL